MIAEKVILDSEGKILQVLINQESNNEEISNIAVPEDIEENKEFYVYSGNEFILDENRKAEYENKKLLLIELEDLEKWFGEYDIQCNQYRRCVELGIFYDKDIMVLHQQAEEKKARINEIRCSLLL